MEDRVVSQTLSSRSRLRFVRGAASTLRRHQVPPPRRQTVIKKKMKDMRSVHCPLGSNNCNSLSACVRLTVKVQSVFSDYFLHVQRECAKFETKNKTVNSDL